MLRNLLIAFLATAPVLAQQPYKRVLKLMGSRFEITVVAPSQQQGEVWIDLAVDEIARIERLISDWDPNSQLSEVNRMAGVHPVSVDLELYSLIERSIAISHLTDGAFDISYASMDKIWRYDGSMTEMPSEQAIRESVARVGFTKIVLDREKQSVFLPEEGMKIGFGAIGKGYAADRAKALLMERGVPAGIINASGDMNTWGRQPDGKPWQVAITNPMDKLKSFGMLPITDQAVVTSGNYEKYVTFGGKRYSHIIDPRTGYPATGILSVTVFAPKAELADALATSVFVMGVSAGLDRINQLPGIECIIVDENGNLHTTDNIELKRNP